MADGHRTEHVVIVQEFIPQYRVEFFAGLAAELERRDIALTVVAGRPAKDVALRQDAPSVPFVRPVSTVRVGKLVWQPCLRSVSRADLVVVEHANRHVLNWVLVAARRLRRTPRIGYWGHGANLQARRRGVAEAVKAWSVTLPDWWFAYTAGSADRVVSRGFPRERTTTVQNSQHTTRGLPTGPTARDHRTAVYVGGLYHEKRIGFLLEIASAAHRRCADFRLVVVGDGPDRGVVESCQEPFVECTGALFGADKAAQLARASLVLNPGLVGLSVVDSFAARTPVVTEESPFHSPEFEYLADGVNAVVLPHGASAEEYAEAILTAMRDPAHLSGLRSGCAASADVYTLDAMITNFADGVERALAAPHRRGW